MYQMQTPPTKNLFSHENLFETNNEVSTQHFSANKNLLPLRYI